MKTEESRDTKLVDESYVDSKKENKVSNLKETVIAGASAVLGGVATAVGMEVLQTDEVPVTVSPIAPTSPSSTPEPEPQPIPSEPHPVLDPLPDPGPIVTPEPIVTHSEEGNDIEEIIIEENVFAQTDGLPEPEIFMGEEDVIVDTSYGDDSDMLLADIIDDDIIPDDLGDSIQQDLIDATELA